MKMLHNRSQNESNLGNW